MEAAFVGAWLALPFVLYAILARSRRARFRSLAAALKGTHVGCGPLAPGRIRGEGFEIEAEQFGKTYRTLVRRAAGATPGDFMLRPEFFEDFPDWRFARVRAYGRQRLFLWEVSMPGYVELDEEQRGRLLHWLGRLPLRSGLGEVLRGAKVREVLIADGWVSTYFRGIVTDLARLERTLDAFRMLAPDERERAAG